MNIIEWVPTVLVIFGVVYTYGMLNETVKEHSTRISAAEKNIVNLTSLAEKSQAFRDGFEVGLKKGEKSENFRRWSYTDTNL